MMPQEPAGIEVSHAELVEALQEMHAAQYQQDFNTIVQLRAGLKKAQQTIADLQGSMRAQLIAANDRIAELDEKLAIQPKDASVDSGSFKDGPR